MGRWLWSQLLAYKEDLAMLLRVGSLIQRLTATQNNFYPTMCAVCTTLVLVFCPALVGFS